MTTNRHGAEAMSQKPTAAHQPAAAHQPRGWPKDTQNCGRCLAWAAPDPIPLREGETQEEAQTRYATAGLPTPKGVCRRFPKPEFKEGADWCLEWRASA